MYKIHILNKYISQGFFDNLKWSAFSLHRLLLHQLPGVFNISKYYM